MDEPERRLLIVDREGTLLRAPRGRYVLGWDDVVVRQEVVQMVAHASRHGYDAVLATNQSCVGRGLTTTAWVDEVNTWLAAEIARVGGLLRLALTCPHTDAAACGCRKPRPGLLHQAGEMTGLALADAYAIGDALVDLQAARAAGIARFLHACPPGGNAVCAEPDSLCVRDFGDFLRALEEPPGRTR